MENEKRLIDANLAIEKQWFYNAHPLIYRQYAVDVLRDATTVDAVEVVRCKDCKHWLDYGVCNRHITYPAIWMEKNDFCSYGERKENG